VAVYGERKLREVGASIKELPFDSSDKTDGSVYDLLGRKVATDLRNAHLLKSGIYIHNKQRIIINQQQIESNVPISQ
ncbi:MAG: hypothetical protein IJ680_09550, partial [Paludibacteraceae bacterium]|nr:hypothetical protein [Paludibacteraceae bacterium]